MFRRLMTSLILLLVLPAFAHAWYVNAKTSPTTGQGTISPTGSQSYAAGVDSGAYTVAPVAGYKLTKVTIDGVTVGTAPGSYTVPYLSTKSYRYIVAYFAANTVNITTSVGANGGIREDSNELLSNVPVGSTRALLIAPASGYQIDTYSAANATSDVLDTFTGVRTITYANLQENQNVSATFSLAPVVTANAGSDVATTGDAVAYAVTLSGSGTSNQGDITYLWSGTGLVFGTPAAAQTTVYSATPGTYTAILTVTSNGIISTDTVTVTVPSRVDFVENQCSSCHSSRTPEVLADYDAGAHKLASGHTTGTCQRCHASEGAIAAAEVGWTGSYATLIANQAAIWTPLTSAVPPLASSDGISCAVCHADTHASGLRAVNTIYNSAVIPWDPNQNAAVDQFDLCTSCHSLVDNTGALVGNYHDGGSINVTRTISDSHYDNPATGVGLASNVVEGYVVRANSASPCADCHNTHMADVAIQEAWASSAHAGKIATKKEEAAQTQSVIWWNTTYPLDPATAYTDVKIIGTSTRTVLEFFQRNAAGITFYKTVGALDDADGNAWTHYNWDQTSSRGSCQRCHTATGAMNFLNSPATYVAAGTGNNFSHLSGWSASTGSPQQELLYCWGCHSDTGSGTLRNPGAITEIYAAATAGSPTATIAYPNIGASNVCMGCHLGREIGQNVKNDIDADGVRSFINSHYLAAGGMIFNAAGYEFDGQSYDSAGFHKNVGQADTYNTGTAGPCVTCHMSSAEAHSFEVSAASTACGQCHGGLTDAILEVSKHEFHLALEELKQALLAKGIEFKPAHPYFYQVGTTTAFTNWASVYGLASWKDVMGAAFNYNIIEHDPGAYAHNREYALKLIQDSIDFLADGAVDGLGVSAAFTAAATNKEFAEQTTHIAATVADPSATNCGICHAQAPHYGGSFGGNAEYMGNNATCSDCHASSNTTANAAILVQYNESGHGDVEGPAWKTSSSHDWPNATGCKDCHSTTGYIAKLGGTARSTVVAGAGQTLACDACHTDLAVDGAVRPAGQVTVVYKSQTLDPVTATWTLAPATFPNATQSNLCINCHSGRESGESIKALTDASMINVSFKNPHYIGAAGMMYAKLGYNFAGQDDLVPGTTTTTYGKSLTANEDGGALTSTHRKLGTTAINGDSHNPAIFVPGFQDSDGPCVTCHMADAENHTWEINAQAFTNVCVNCHDEEAGTPLTVDNYEELFIEEQAIPFHDAIELAVAKLAAYNISYSDAYPYFFDNNLVPAGAVKDWTRGGTLSAAEAKQLMGACLNIKLMKAEPAAYVHARSYARRLLYDTIDWLDNKILDLSTGATALAWDPAKYVKDTTAGGTTTESTKYLLKYNRTTLAWDTLSERP